MEIEMSAHYPVLPIAAGASVRAFAAVLAFVTYWAKQMARARRHRRDAAMLAGLDRRMLADIGITRSDVRDAFSEPFWEDPTALLRERALERRWNRALQRDEIATRAEHRNEPRAEAGFRRPPTDRPARQAV
jgi:uncharacterized protein YjiS (DUF1127 family)